MREIYILFNSFKFNEKMPHPAPSQTQRMPAEPKPQGAKQRRGPGRRRQGLAAKRCRSRRAGRQRAAAHSTLIRTRDGVREDHLFVRP